MNNYFILFKVSYPEAGYDEKDWVLDPNHSYYYLVTGDPFAKPRVDSKFIMRLNKMLLNGNREKKGWYCVDVMLILMKVLSMNVDINSV